MLSIIAGLLLSVSSVNYSPPVTYEVTLAGNFGEPRPNHFHGGIDVKTGGVEGKPIYSIGDGYVSRITVGLNGFGNAVYVTHPEGHTSVYCHLRSFSPRIRRLLRRWQYEHQSEQADVRLCPPDCPVSRGQLIAVSGNTGSSQAPHLHLELHDTRTWNMLDPLDFLSSCVKDSLPPMAHAFMVYPVRGEGTFCGGTAKQSFPFTSHNLTGKFTAWGRVGFAIWANDYSETTYNRYGVRETVLTVDGREVFRSCVDNIAVQSNRMVNSWGDYDHYYRTGVWYMRSFIPPGLRLPMLKADENRGIIDFNEERDYHIKYILRDFHGNISSYSFIVKGEKNNVREQDKYKGGDSLMKLRWNIANMYSRPGMQLVIPAGCLADDAYISPVVREQSASERCLSPLYTFTNRPFPLLGNAELSIAVRRKVADPSKLYIVCNSERSRFIGGNYHKGWVTANVRELGASYELEYDDHPPQISPVGEHRWDDTHIIRIGLYDAGSGVKSFRGYVDGRFVLFESVPKSPWVICDLSDTPVRKTGKKHRLRFVATDNRDNTATFEREIVY